jgi:hypothetical protein
VAGPWPPTGDQRFDDAAYAAWLPCKTASRIGCSPTLGTPTHDSYPGASHRHEQCQLPRLRQPPDARQPRRLARLPTSVFMTWSAMSGVDEDATTTDTSARRRTARPIEGADCSRRVCAAGPGLAPVFLRSGTATGSPPTTG